MSTSSSIQKQASSQNTKWKKIQNKTKKKGKNQGCMLYAGVVERRVHWGVLDAVEHARTSLDVAPHLHPHPLKNRQPADGCCHVLPAVCCFS